MRKRPYILSIGGFDPSGGAGLLADIKTFENLRCQNLAVCTANTIQTDLQFDSCHWTPKDQVREQLDILLKRFVIGGIKIGLIHDWAFLEELLIRMNRHAQNIPIIWDPVWSSSTSFDFHPAGYALGNVLENNSLENSLKRAKFLERLTLISPNEHELSGLFPDTEQAAVIEKIQEHVHLFVSGGHSAQVGTDRLFHKNGRQYVLNPRSKKCYPKHGSGCVLSSAIVAHLALGFPLLKACFRAKRYTEKFLESSKDLIGYHNA